MMLSSTAERLSRRPISKSPNAFRTIAEVACELDLPAHVLRFWETKFPQVKPLKRKGGRRYYRPEDVALLRQIRSLLHSEGYTIKGVQRLLREGGVKSPEPPAEAAVGTPERPSFADLDPAAPSPSGDGNKEHLRAVLSELLALRALLGNSEL